MKHLHKDILYRQIMFMNLLDEKILNRTILNGGNQNRIVLDREIMKRITRIREFWIGQL